MSIDAIKTAIPQIAPIGGTPLQPAPAGANDGPAFSEMLSEAIQEVSSLQKEADQQIERVVLKQDGATTHEAMLALEKADMAFQLMNNIRSKIIRAYEDIIRTQV